MRKLGHIAWSCDVIECSGGHPEWHIQQDVLPLLNGDCMFQAVNAVITQTPFTIADVIVWKKATALPNSTSSNRLTRI